MEGSDDHSSSSSNGGDGDREADLREQDSEEIGHLHREENDPKPKDDAGVNITLDINPLDDETSKPCDEDALCTYTCPICLCELAVIRKEGSDSEEINEAGIPIFKLSCQHKYCSTCLHEYVKSKLMGGDLKISCCHSHPTAADEKEADLCNVTIARCDIKRLLHMDYFRSNSYVSDWIQSTAQDAKKTMRVDLWEKFEKLEFDNFHGKNSVRRCPTCDEAALFDIEAMKRHQAKFESIHTDSATSGSVPSGRGSNYAAGFDRFFRSIRQTQESSNNTTTTTAADASSNAEEKPVDEEQPTVSDSEEDHHSAENGLVKSKSPVITCGLCRTEFCYFHSNAHEGQSCLAYHEATLGADRTNLEFAARVLRAKPCPNCGISVTKEGGCNQMKCSSCNTHFCWLCSAIVDDGPFPDHFRWWNLKGCPNMQLDESTEPRMCTRVFAKVLSVLQLIILGVPSVALSIISMLICPCLVPGCGSNMRERVRNCVSFWGSCLSTVIMLPFTLLGLLIAASFYCFVAAIMCCLKIPKNNDVALGQRGNQTARHTAPADNNVAAQQASIEELIREIENIFGRLEEDSIQGGVEQLTSAESNV